MKDISAQEYNRLTSTIHDIYLYKCMLSHGYERILRKSTGSRAGRLLQEIHIHEQNDAEQWLGYLHSLDPGAAPSRQFFEFRIFVMMSILGRRGFLEWALIAEDESVGDLLVIASLLHDRSGKIDIPEFTVLPSQSEF